MINKNIKSEDINLLNIFFRKYNIDNKDVLITGSVSFYIINYRNYNDLDLIVSKNVRKKLYISSKNDNNIFFHKNGSITFKDFPKIEVNKGKILKFLNISDESLIYNNEYFIYKNNYKIIKPEIYFLRKKYRCSRFNLVRKKDIYDYFILKYFYNIKEPLFSKFSFVQKIIFSISKKYFFYKNKIIITGPDGSGKSTIVKHLKRNIKNSAIIIAEKKGPHFLYFTKIGFKLLSYLKNKNKILYFIYLYFVFYFLEYLENLYKFIKCRNKFIIYERHPIDRVRLFYEFKLCANNKNIIYYFKYLILFFWKFIYLNFFPKSGKMFLLLPTSKLCFLRSGGQYRNIYQAKQRINSYKLASEDLIKRKQKIIIININEETSIDKIIKKIKYEIYNF